MAFVVAGRFYLASPKSAFSLPNTRAANVCGQKTNAGKVPVFFGVPLSPLSQRRQSRVSFHSSKIVSQETSSLVQDTTTLGSLTVPSLGIGIWAWGDRLYWGYNPAQDQELKNAYRACLDAGLNMFDTAEVYGPGRSEELLGDFAQTESGFDADGKKREIIVLTKFAALPWRVGPASVVCACKDSLKRLRADSMALYQQHWPGVWQNDEYLDGLAEVVNKGLAKEVGVSNFNVKRTKAAVERLKSKGVTLASNQVQFSLLYRDPELNGLLDTCGELGIKLIAYSPIAQGLLTGRYNENNLPTGPRARLYTPEKLRSIKPLIETLREIGAQYGGKTPGQVALNWIICKGALPIPGAKNTAQVSELAGALGWRLSASDIAALDSESRRVQGNIPGMPLANL
mmetsp:Transcript_9789/g.16055  ORF Transcript_9789/g.16055 Transcript_9789/m.16055 type:complete len:399 (-) Transcript_9789:989-2185(-)|eukprot:CAMPEP_0184656930 /NCGR_PEP_ID=MMETSP0308-20130426/16855_1 /TAXON_ID=38269 /ORGANISM="Gloeochaete witrockiana, Strain SAG 46.84" /LENGTH=398 /DNA_ID=CAMNT_0027094261 /DNA_START=153 /DNA_END=1349 /DNA_ORIENTATION=-